MSPRQGNLRNGYQFPFVVALTSLSTTFFGYRSVKTALNVEDEKDLVDSVVDSIVDSIGDVFGHFSDKIVDTVAEAPTSIADVAEPMEKLVTEFFEPSVPTQVDSVINLPKQTNLITQTIGGGKFIMRDLLRLVLESLILYITTEFVYAIIRVSLKVIRRSNNRKVE